MIMRNKETSRSKRGFERQSCGFSLKENWQAGTLVETAQQGVLLLVTATVTKYLKPST